MNKNARYIKTYIDNRPGLLRLTSCNLCPFLSFDKKNRMVRCSRFTYNIKNSPDLFSNIIDTSINAYSISGNICLPLTDINIPDWCKLAKDSLDGQNGVYLYYKDDSNNTQVVNNIITTLPITSSTLAYHDRKLTKLITKDIKTVPALPANTFPPYRKPFLNKCSCCGEEKEKIDRNKNIGMCDSCWDKYKDDEKSKYFSFVNNFRLKRNSTWIDKIDKKIEEKM